MNGKFVSLTILIAILNLVFNVRPVFSGQANIAGYAHCRTIVIDNSGCTEALINYQVKVKLDITNFHFDEAMDNGEDIYFTDENGVTPLDFWIQEWDKIGRSAIIWVEVPLIPSSSEKTIYFHYGKPGEISVSDGESTFVFFDNFTKGMTKWVSQPGVSIEENRLKIQGGTSIRSNATFPPANYSIFCKIWGIGEFILCYIDANAGVGYGFSEETNSMFKGYTISSFSLLRCIGGADGPSTVNATYILENARLSEYNYGMAIDSDDNSIAMIRSDSVHIDNFFVQLRTLYGIFYVEYVAIRKYAEPEPSVTVVSEHELTLSIHAPNSVHPDSLINFDSIVRNEGQFADLHVKVYFFVNGTFVNATYISELDANKSVHLGFTWHSPHIEGYYNLSVQIVPVPQEINTTNNQISKIVKVAKLSLSLSPETGFASVTLVGSGFANQANITITWDGQLIPTIPSPLMTDAYGGFTALISVPTPNAPGPHIVKASDKEGNEFETAFTVLEKVPFVYILILAIPAFIAICLATYTLILFKRKEAKAGHRVNTKTDII